MDKTNKQTNKQTNKAQVVVFLTLCEFYQNFSPQASWVLSSCLAFELLEACAFTQMFISHNKFSLYF